MLRVTYRFFSRIAGVGLSLLILTVGSSAQPSRLLPGGRPRSIGSVASVPGRPPASGGIMFENGLLSVNVRDQDLRTLLEHIAAQGGIEIRHAEGLPEKRVSLRFDTIPVVDGLKRLFRAADLTGYALVTETQGGQVKVQRILFLPAQEGAQSSRLSARAPSPAPRPRSRSARVVPPAASPPEKSEPGDASESQSVFDEIKTNTTARRLLSQLVHPNEQVRERALERLIRIVGNDEKQAELLEFLEPLMEQLASEDKQDRDEARAEIRKLLSR